MGTKVLSYRPVTVHANHRPVKATEMKPLIIFDMRLPRLHSSSDGPSPMIPGAAVSLAASLQQEELADIQFMPRSLLLGGELPIIDNPKRPIFFALTLYDRFFEGTCSEARLLKKFYPNAIIMIGGPSVNTANSLKDLATFFPAGTVMVKGDGEKVICKLVKALSAKPLDWKTLETLPGVYVRQKSREYANDLPNLASEAELNAQPGLPELPELRAEIERLGQLMLHTSRSCKYRCIFCSHKIHPVPIYWSAERVVQELHKIRGMIEKGLLPEEARSINFTDDDFFQDRGRALSFLAIINRDPRIKGYFSFSLQGSVGSFFYQGKLDVKMLDLLKSYDDCCLYLGTDGFHPEALKKLIKGGSNWARVTRLLKALDDRGIPQMHYVILTYPEISKDILIATAKNIISALQLFKTLSLSINSSLIAYENNGLMPLAMAQGDPEVATSPTGITKLLPTRVKIADQRAEETLKAFNQTPLVDMKEGLALVVGARTEDESQFWQHYLRKFSLAKKAWGKTPTFWHALCETRDPYFQVFALSHLIELLKAS